jgi:hypothetical protein
MSNNLEEVQRLQSLGFSLEEAVEVEEAQRRVNDSDHLCMGCREIGPACYCGNLLEIELLCMRDPEYREGIERIRRRFRPTLLVD